MQLTMMCVGSVGSGDDEASDEAFHSITTKVATSSSYIYSASSPRISAQNRASWFKSAQIQKVKLKISKDLVTV